MGPQVYIRIHKIRQLRGMRYITDPAVRDKTNKVLRWQRLKHRHKELHEVIILTELATHTHTNHKSSLTNFLEISRIKKVKVAHT